MRPPAVCLLGVLLAGCGLFETRDPEPPGSSTCLSTPPTRPLIVITNLQSAVAQKCPDNYAACFSRGGPGERPYVFTASAEAREQYGPVLLAWVVEDEDAYFRNLVARSVTNGFSSLELIARDSLIATDSVVYTFDYVFTIEHTEPGFPITARGNMQITLSANPNTFWSISRWVDLKTTPDATWSLFKGKFSG
jgi:hypothetical protein